MCPRRYHIVGLIVIGLVGSICHGYDKDNIRVGIIGLDTSHATAFTKLLNAEDAEPGFAGCRVVAAYPRGSRDIESSIRRVPDYTRDVEAMGVAIVDSIEALLPLVDVVLLESNDGRPHLEQLRPVLKAGKPVFVDKPMAGSLSDVMTMFREARMADVPIFSSSALRYSKSTQAVHGGSIGRVLSCETRSPAHLEKSHPDLFWYGIHGVESLVTVMGTGCQTVTRSEEDGKIVVRGRWPGNREGVFREDDTYAGIARGENGEATVGDFESYEPLLREIVRFFRTGVPPVSEKETLEVYALMEAADESKRRNGAEVMLETVLQTHAAAQPDTSK